MFCFNVKPKGVLREKKKKKKEMPELRASAKCQRIGILVTWHTAKHQHTAASDWESNLRSDNYSFLFFGMRAYTDKSAHSMSSSKCRTQATTKCTLCRTCEAVTLFSSLRCLELLANAPKVDSSPERPAVRVYDTARVIRKPFCACSRAIWAIGQFG